MKGILFDFWFVSAGFCLQKMISCSILSLKWLLFCQRSNCKWRKIKLYVYVECRICIWNLEYMNEFIVNCALNCRYPVTNAIFVNFFEHQRVEYEINMHESIISSSPPFGCDYLFTRTVLRDFPNQKVVLVRRQLDMSSLQCVLRKERFSFGRYAKKLIFLASNSVIW